MISALLDDRRPVYVAGRRFTLRKISLTDVVRFQAFLSRRSELVTEVSVEAGARLLESVSRLQVAEILGWLMEPCDPAWVAEHLTPEQLRELLLRVEDMNNIPLIFEKLNLSGARPGRAGAQQEAPPGEQKVARRSGLELVVDIVARRYGRPPHEIMNWPVEELLAVIATIEEELEELPATAGEARRPKLHANDAPDVAITGMGGEVGRRIH